MASRTSSKDIITLRGSAAIVSEFFGTHAPPSLHWLILCATHGRCLMECFASHRRLRGEQVRYTHCPGRRRRRRLFIAGWVGEKCVRFRFTNPIWFWWFYSILYNRGVYPEESFTKVKYGLTMLLTRDEGVKAFIASITSQLSGRRPPWDLSLLPSPQLDCLEAEMCSALLIGVVVWISDAEWLEAGKLQRIVLVIMSKATSEVLERWNFNIETDPEVVEKGCVTPDIHPPFPSWIWNGPIACSHAHVELWMPAASPQGDKGEERQGDHEGDPGHHAPGRFLHHLPPLPWGAM
jgi:hypothetical protein